MRLQKYMAMCGVAARRKCEELIAEGRVSVNGVVRDVPGTTVEEGDVVTLDGQVIRPEEHRVVILYHKPAGEVCTVSDDRDRETVMDHFRDLPERVYPIGRLDYDTEGVLLLTNDGELAQKLTHPSSEVDKVYLARVSGRLSPEEVRRLRTGVLMEGEERMTWPARVRIVREGDIYSDVIVIIHEGRNRQVRRMIAAVGHQVVMLRRVRFGPIDLGSLQRGPWRYLTEEEVEKLHQL
ncbi:MAG: rRNA pseudouridine synthase [Clostridia bacterium]|nr:rRNA pseudouridine synthase [Clostridia bacterium]